MASEFPTGTITLLFTDVEGSTRLLYERGTEYASLLAEHHAIVRAAIARHHGVEVDTQGDAFFAAFDHPTDAVQAAITIQRDLRDTPIRVRMGVHTGTPLRTGSGYIGPDVHLAARVCSAAHGGQVLISPTTRALVATIEMADLGIHRLKDIPDAQHLYQVGTEDFPPLRARHETNLPIQPTDLIGREREQHEINALLQDPATRLVTLTGPGGVGKTGLALRVAAGRIPNTPDGVYFIDLTQVRDAGLVLPAIAQTLGSTGTLAEFLGSRAALLVIDNMEHVIDAADRVAELLVTCHRIQLLVTSRIHLGLRAERRYAVAPLAQADAVALFTRRAGLRMADDPASVGAICLRLDGLPLAIELAASRAGQLDLKDMLERLEHQLAILTSGPRDLPERQRTLRAVIGWSADLLPEPERKLFRRLAVFEGGWSLDEAEVICEAGIDELGRLVDSSLVQRTGGRYSYLETVRELAVEELVSSGEYATHRERHAGYYADACRRWRTDPGAFRRSGDGRDMLRESRANFRAALEWFKDHDPAQIAQMVPVIWKLWLQAGASEEGERWARLAVESSDLVDSPARAYLLEVWGEFPRFAGDWQRAVPIKLEALEMGRRLGHPPTIAAVLQDLTSLYAAMGELGEARACGDEALRLREADGDQHGISHALGGLAELEMRAGNAAEAERILRRSDELEASIDAPEDVRIETKTMLVNSLRAQGRIEEARDLGTAVLTTAMRRDDKPAVMDLLIAFAEMSSRDEPEIAAQLLGAVAALLERVRLVPFDGLGRDACAERVHRTLGNELYEAAVAKGRQLTEDEVRALVA